MAIRHLAAVVYVAALAAACSGDHDKTFRLPPAPSEPSPPPTLLTPTVREIAIGETVNADILIAGPQCATSHERAVPCHYFAFTPSADGTVTATLTWDPATTDTILLLRIENTQIEASGPPWSPLVGQVTVHAGQRYALQVGMAGTGDDSTPKPYVLTTSLR